MNMNKEKRTIDLTPTWSAVLPILINTLTSDDFSYEQKEVAKRELQNMARVADMYVAANKKPDTEE